MKSLFSKVKPALWVVFACAVYALGFVWCYEPNDIAFGGLTGVAQILFHLLGRPSIGILIILLNLPLFLLSWRVMGGRFLLGSLLTMALSSVMIDALGFFHAFKPMEPILACIFGGVFLGVSLGIIFLQGGTTGGTDLLARLLKLKLAWLPMGSLLMAIDLVVILAAALVFRQLSSALYGLVSLYIASVVMDKVLYGLDNAKVAYIITDHSRAVADAIVDRLDRGVTLLYGEGAYSGEEKRILLCAFKQRQIVALKHMVNEIDPMAFLIVCEAHEVFGDGFRKYRKNDI